MNTHTTRGAGRARFLAAGMALAAGLLVAPQAGAQGGYDHGPGDRGPGRSGQQRMDPGQRLERRVSLLTERLQLSSQQQTQVRQILTREGEQVQALFPNGRGQDERSRAQDSTSRAAMRSRMQAIRTQTDQQIERVLTAQQRATYRTLQAERQKRHDGARERDGTRRGQRP